MTMPTATQEQATPAAAPAKKVLVDELLLEEISPPKPKPAVSDDQVEQILLMMKQALVKDLEDDKQTRLVDAVQASRQMLLQYAMQQYLSNPKSASLLEGVTSLIAHIEKTVRDDRKEKAKEKEGESNVIHFNQMLEAMKLISANKVVVPAFNVSAFILDPNKSLIPQGNPEIAPIKPEELVQGNAIVNIDGETV